MNRARLTLNNLCQISGYFFCLLVLLLSCLYLKGSDNNLDSSTQQEEEIIIKAIDPEGLVDYDLNTGAAMAEKGVRVIYQDLILTAKTSSD